MEDALKLEGYLMKEKSKLSLLHGLTGDVNKRYFRIRSIEGSEELALCYYKNITDPEVRGWIYLKDVTEVEENQDTIILSSVARTLHLYAQTRAQHNQWVTGLAKLCPDAFATLGRNASVETTSDGVPPRGSARTPSTIKKPVETSLTKDHHESSIDVPAADVFTPQMSLTVDGQDSGPSTIENYGPAACFGTPREHDKPSMQNSSQQLDERPEGHREPGERRASWSTTRSDSDHMAGDTTDGYQKRRSSYGGRSPQRSSSGFVKHGELSRKERMRYRKEKLGRRHKGSEDQSERNAHIVDEVDIVSAGSPTSSHRSAGDTADEGDKCSAKQLHPPGRRRGLEASGTRNNGNGRVEGKGEKEQRSEPHATKSARDMESDITIEQEREIGTSMDVGGVVQEGPHGDEFTKRSRVYSSDNEIVETIELCEGTRCNNAQDHAKNYEQQQAGGRIPTDVGRGNQDEDTEFDEDAEIDREVPQLEIGTWSATSRLHRHIAQTGTEAGNLNGSIPPPKEFLKQGLLENVVSDQHEVGRANAIGGHNRDTEKTSSADVPKSVSNGRRRSAADLEWSDGGETPDRPRCLEDNLTQPMSCGPVDLGDSNEDGKDDLDLEVEEQRRRATAALIALETAVKEADEGAQKESEALARFKRQSEGGVRGVVAKTYPFPAAPPPPSLVRKARRGRGVPPPGVAPPKAVRTLRVKAANHRAVPDDNCVRDDWDDELKTPCHGSPVSGGRGTGGLLAAAIGAARHQANHWTQFEG